MAQLEESIKSIDELVTDLKHRREGLDALIERKITELKVADFKPPDEVRLIQKELHVKYDTLIEEKIKKLEESKKGLLFLKNQCESMLT